MDLGGWLRSLGLEEYEAAFHKNHIDETVLSKLTAEDLRDIGVGSVGHRRKLLDAIALLRAGPTTKPPPPEASASRPPQDTAERRQVTVMFSDLVGSTALSARIDPEDLREVISAYQKCVAQTVQRFGGFVAKYMGDGGIATPNLAARLQTLAEPGSLCDRRGDAATVGRRVRAEGAGVAGLERFWGGRPRVGGAARGGERQPLRGSTLGGPDALRRARA
jgi:SAM domain (Sterile alpha motif)/Adenylate and Guanylate cyclase catalytic domain